MHERAGSPFALTVGEVRLPDGHARSSLPPRIRRSERPPLPARIRRHVRSVLVFALLTTTVAVPVAAVRAGSRAEPVAEPATATLVRAAGQAATIDAIADGERAVRFAQRALAERPDDPRALISLAFAYLQRVRETADPTYYTKAEELARRAAARAPDDPAVSMVSASLALARHDFAQALEHAHAAVRRAPRAPASHAVLVDALVELGRYDEAVAAAQVMVDLRPDLASYSRVSYIRELHGDLDGAIDALRRAVDAGAPLGEGTAWAEVQLGHLLFATGDRDGAATAYEGALRRVAGYPHALAGLARIRAARGDLSAAADQYEAVVRRLPLPEYIAALGDTYARLGDADRAEEQYALVAATGRLLAASGVRVGSDLALFDLDHGRDQARALAAARAEYAVRPSTHVAGALAWAELHAGDPAGAMRHSAEALRLGTRDPLMLYRAGVIAEAAGDVERARDLLRRSHDQDPEFSILFAPDLRARLARLDAR